MDFTENTIESEILFEGKILTLKKDKVSLPNGGTSFREIVEHHGGVCIAPITDDNEFIFVRQYRYAYGEMVLELPAGKLEKGEDNLDAGIRELEEETGMVADKIINLGHCYPSPGYTNEYIYLYAAKGLHETEQKLDADEFLALERIPVEKAVEMVMNNEIYDSKTQIIILKVNELMKKGEI